MKNHNTKLHLFLPFSLTAFIIVADQLTKLLCVGILMCFFELVKIVASLFQR